MRAGKRAEGGSTAGTIPNKSTRRGKATDRDTPSLGRRLVVLAMVAVWAFVFLSMVGFNAGDPPSHAVWPPNRPIANWCGPVGASVAYGLIKFFGFGAWVIVTLVGFGLFSAAVGQTVRHALVRLIGLFMLTAAFSGAQALMLPHSGPFPDLSGGLLGKVGVAELTQRLGAMGAGLIVLVMGIIGALVAMDEWMLAMTGWAWKNAREKGVPAAKVVGVTAGSVALAAGAGAAKASGGFFSNLIARLRRSEPEVRQDDLDDEPSNVKIKKDKKAAKSAIPAEDLDISDPDKEMAGPGVDVVDEDQDAEADEDGETAVVVDEDEDAEYGDDESDDDGDASEPRASAREKKSESRKKTRAQAQGSDGEDDDGGAQETPGAPQVFDENALREKIAKLPVVFGQNNKSVATAEDLKQLQNLDEGDSYKFPGLDLLEEPEANFNEKLEEYVRGQAQSLESAMKQYKIDGGVVGIESGPVITMFDVRLAPGTKVAQIEAISKDIARSMKAINIRIVTNQQGRDTIGIEVPNEVKEKVRLKELMGRSEKYSAMKLPMFLGKDAAGEPLIEDLTKMPHMLIAGTTGSGKSVCMNTIIMGFLYTKKPSELKMVLVDPKMVEMSQFKDIPHLMCPVVTEMGKATAILEWACGKMDERYELLADAGCRDIATYNELTWDELKERLGATTPEEEARIPRKLPYMVFVIDELADLMMTNKEVEGSIIRIAQKARAVGIHLILATQRPQANVVTGLIKSNMPCRVAFKVASGMDSRIVLDQKGGELLLGQGDMLFLSPRRSELIRSQGTLVNDREIRNVVKFMREVATPSFDRSLLQIRRAGAEGPEGSGLANLTDEERLLQSQNNSSASLAAAQEDPLFPRAVEIVLETKRGSVSLLQRRLAIGYTRSSRLIDLMGIAGIISDHKGSVARDVLITEGEWKEMKRLAEEEAKAKGIVLRTDDGMEQAELFVEPKSSGTAAGQPSAEAPPFDVHAEADTAQATDIVKKAGKEYQPMTDDDL